MPNWKKVIVSGSDATLNSLIVTSGVTGSLVGTASFALTASYVNPLRQDVILSGSLYITGSSRIGVGTTNPAYTIDLPSGSIRSFTVAIGNDAAGSAVLSTSGNYMFVAGNNNHDVILPGLFAARSGTGYGVGIQATQYPAVATSAILTLTSTTKGFLPTRTNLTSNISAPAQGLMTYITASSTEGLYYYNSGSYQGWTRVLNDSGSQSITGSLTIGTTTTGSSENTLTLGPPTAGGAGEGGQLGFNAVGGTYTSASFIDNWQNKARILKGNNTTSTGLIAQWDIHTTQMQLPGYTAASSFPGTAAANLAVDSGGNVITVSTTGGSVFPYVGNAVITGSLTTTGIIYAQPNGGMYFQGGDDAALYDINVSNHMGIYGVQDSTIGSIKLGSGGGIVSGKSGNIGIGTTNPTSASFQVNGNVWATSFTGSLFGTASWASNVVGGIGVTSVGTSGTVSGITLTGGTITSTGTITLGGSISGLTTSNLSGTAGITNAQLANSSVTVGSTAISLGGTSTTLAGLTNVTSTSFTGSLFGTSSWARNAVTASFAQTASYAFNPIISGSITGVDYIDFDTNNIIGTNEPAWKEGRVFYDSGSGALAVYNWEQDVTLNVGQESWLRARNQTGVTITNGSVVRLSSAIGDRPTIVLAQSTDQTNTFSTGNEIIGIATHDIEHGTDGFITTFGLVNGLNTSAYAAGDLLWVSQSAGQFTNVPPPPPFDRTFVGIVTRVNASNGSIFSTPLTPIHFHDISSVSASIYQQGDLWMYRSGSAGQANAWINTKALSGSYGITGSLITSGSDGKGINTSTTELHAGAGTGITVNWGSGQLFDNNNINTVDWLNSYTLTSPSYGGVSTVQWNSGWLKSLNTSMSIDWDTRYAYDSSENITIDWNNKQLIQVGNASVDWASRILYDSNTDTGLNWDAFSNGYSVQSGYYYKSLVRGQALQGFVDTPANITNAVNCAGEVVRGDLDTSVVLYDLVYLDTSGIWFPVTQSTDQCTKLIGICIDVGDAYILLEGTLTVSSNVATTNSPYVQSLAAGRPIYIRENSGSAMSTTSPGSSGNYVRVLGHAYSQSATNTDYYIMKFRPSNDWITI